MASSSPAPRNMFSLYLTATLTCAAACSDGGPTGSEGSYELSVSEVVTVLQGKTRTATVFVTRSNFAGPVTLSLGNAPPNVTGSFNPAAPTGNSSTLTLSVGSTVPPGSYSVTVQGIATSGNRSTSLPLFVHVAGVLAETITAGGFHTCALTVTDIAYCWGRNLSGQLGSSPRDGLYPSAVSGTQTFTAITGGANHTCALTPTGTPYCWGLGNGSGTDSPTPAAVSGGHVFTSISAGSNHTCGLTAAGAAYCWGEGVFGQLGTGTTPVSSPPAAVSGNLVFKAVTAGGDHTCGITTDDAAYCWGHNAWGALGDSTSGNSKSAPVAVKDGLTFEHIAAGNFHTCGITTDSAAFCWGLNAYGQLGDETMTDRPAPVAVSGGFRFISIAAGAFHTCAITSAGVTSCWGRNSSGELGDASTVNSSTPVGVFGGLAFTVIAPGHYNMAHTCAITTSGATYCWGANFDGQLGDGTTTDRLVPTPVAGWP